MITPLGNNIQITIEKAETVTSSGIILARENTEKLERSTVLAIGEDVTRVHVGDVVLYKSYTSDTMSIDGEDVAFIKEDDVLATYTHNAITASLITDEHATRA